jgi:hypothetical protein
MKHVSDLFWIPKDSNMSASHWQFDESYSVIHHEDFSSERSDEMKKSTFSGENRNTFPVPIFDGSLSQHEYEHESGSGSEHEWSNDVIERGTSTRTQMRVFLPFPDGFCADLYSSESHSHVVDPISFW